MIARDLSVGAGVPDVLGRDPGVCEDAESVEMYGSVGLEEVPSGGAGLAGSSTV